MQEIQDYLKDYDYVCLCVTDPFEWS